jgi:hypothetical protein
LLPLPLPMFPKPLSAPLSHHSRIWIPRHRSGAIPRQAVA